MTDSRSTGFFETDYDDDGGGGARHVAAGIQLILQGHAYIHTIQVNCVLWALVRMHLYSLL